MFLKKEEMEKKENGFALIDIKIHSEALCHFENGFVLVFVCLFCKLVIQGTGSWQTCLESLYTEGLI